MKFSLGVLDKDGKNIGDIDMPITFYGSDPVEISAPKTR